MICMMLETSNHMIQCGMMPWQGWWPDAGSPSRDLDGLTDDYLMNNE